MKNSIQAKKQHLRQQPRAEPVPAPKPQSSWLRRIIPALCLVISSGGATWALFEYVVWNTMPPELVGKWVVVSDGPQEGATFDFYRNGRMHGRINLNGKLAQVDAAIRVEDQIMYSTTHHPHTRQADTRMQRIRKLTANLLILEDEHGKVLKLERTD